MLSPTNPVIGRQWRGTHLESQHRGVWALVDTDGKVVASYGDPTQTIFARSSSKSLQALPFVMSGAIEQFDLKPRHIALTLASHSGEDMHLAGVQQMLHAAALDEDHLQCGASRPLFAHSLRSASPLCHCCSGKHAGFLAATVAVGADPATYLAPDSPIQQQVRTAVLAMTGSDPSDIDVAIDGCSAPTYCLPLLSLAVGIARVANPSAAGVPDDFKDACVIVTNAAAEYPEMVAGDEPARFDTALMRATNGRLFSKTGADGVQVIGVADAGVAFVGKCDDGAARAILPIAAKVLTDHGHLADDEAIALSQWCSADITNAAGTVTGRHEIVHES